MSFNSGWEKQVKKMLLHPQGRAALKKFGIDVEIQKPGEDKPIVAILCPTYRSPEPRMQDALAAMVRYTREKGIATVYGGPPVQASVVHWSRNVLVSEQIKSGKPWTHVLFIDDDIVVEPDALERLLSHKKDLIAGLCTRRNDPPVPNMRCFYKEDGSTREIWEWPENQCIEVDAVGTGLMLLSRHALEQVAQVYFDCLWEQEFYGLSGEKLDKLKEVRSSTFKEENKICYWFRFLPAQNGNIEMGEDVTFCFLAKRYCDIPIMVDTAVQPGHLGSYAFSIKDFMPYRDLCIAKAKAEGKYKTKEPPSFSIVILSQNAKNLIPCVESIIKNEPDFPRERIFVVDDGAKEQAEKELPGITWVEGKKPFIFSRNVNLGIQAAQSDVMLLNDDTQLVTPKGFTELSKSGPGIISCAIQGPVGNRNQVARGGTGLRHEQRMLCFIAVFIPKSVQDKLGPLDERFTGYGFDDDDYCKRAVDAGIPLFTFDGCVVDHEHLTPTFRSREGWQDSMAGNKKIFEEKYAAAGNSGLS